MRPHRQALPSGAQHALARTTATAWVVALPAPPYGGTAGDCSGRECAWLAASLSSRGRGVRGRQQRRTCGSRPSPIQHQHQHLQRPAGAHAAAHTKPNCAAARAPLQACLQRGRSACSGQERGSAGPHAARMHAGCWPRRPRPAAAAAGGCSPAAALRTPRACASRRSAGRPAGACVLLVAVVQLRCQARYCHSLHDRMRNWAARHYPPGVPSGVRHPPVFPLCGAPPSCLTPFLSLRRAHSSRHAAVVVLATSAGARFAPRPRFSPALRHLHRAAHIVL